ncbi:MAG: presenilin family intramembrane aspartyl protease [Candidatus Marsarchaeota archaeon]|nr:presenilin family intramembrane aspartyl protease [Candidatus Marsarchaeota archaeon]MCL5111613.1 presenilin family intramembrane aspartyl protease [Candidatus Marsarchaeota archaeon]
MRVIETRQVLQILVIFMIVQFFGLFLASEIYSGATYQQVTTAQVVTSAASALFFIVYIIVLALVLLLIMKLYKGDKLFIIFEGAVVFLTSFFVFMLVSGLVTTNVLFSIAGNAITTNFIIGIAAALALIALKNRFPKLRNTATIIASVGVGLVIGVSFSFIVALIFMAILAVYDFIAVFVTKHMITMARAMSSRNLAFLVGVNEMEAIPKSSFSSGEIAEFKKEIKGVKMPAALTRMYKQGMLPVAAHMELGAGDLAVPLMVAVAAYKVSFSFTLSLFIVIGSILGLILTTFILRRYKRPLPAIPPLLLGVLAGILMYLLL